MSRGADKTVQRLSGDPAGVATVADDEGVGAFQGFESERQTRSDRHHHPEPSRAERRTARHPRHMTGNVEAASKLFNHAVFWQKSQRRKRRVIADAGVPVFDGVMVMVVV